MLTHRRRDTLVPEREMRNVGTSNAIVICSRWQLLAISKGQLPVP